MPPAGDTTVRAVRSNRAYGDALFYLFVFNPEEPRPFDRRVRLARAHAREMGCRWVDAPEATLVAETARQGPRYTDTMLVAPLRCT